jgi:hypothetical protein
MSSLFGGRKVYALAMGIALPPKHEAVMVCVEVLECSCNCDSFYQTYVIFTCFIIRSLLQRV